MLECLCVQTFLPFKILEIKPKKKQHSLQKLSVTQMPALLPDFNVLEPWNLSYDKIYQVTNLTTDYWLTKMFNWPR